MQTICETAAIVLGPPTFIESQEQKRAARDRLLPALAERNAARKACDQSRGRRPHRQADAALFATLKRLNKLLR